ncbi:AAA family ATPase [Paenimyroides viscosum]|uniref:ATPase AAA-type core domain-containing protein n=1 Tax=Paenimyroides viscosum TaxID=2488729 RepID=A0A3P1B696_9FLAO|nr:AAA family ATPase [Paenimyroides viscosum]RRA96511.1 hypothetical protein EG242_02635 [Paenimyroides viscosum]
MSFKLLAIRPLEGCEENILNNLQVNKFYFFDDSYKQYKDHDFIIKKENYNELNPDFYYSKNENTESTLQSININAIVGKNGSGKSSIIEFLLRLLNNFFKGIDENNKLEKLICVEGIVGELYILQDEKLYKIYINFSINKYKEDAKNKKNEIREYINVLEIPQIISGKVLENDGFKNQSYKNEKYSVKNETKFKVDDYFFTMYVNYSLYGLDEKDFEDDGFIYDNRNKVNVSWLNKIFHKNDGYQTPVVIHPYRESAMIDVRREKELMKQRLSALIFTNEEYRTVIPQYSFDEIRFRLKAETALDHFLIYQFEKQEEDKATLDIFPINISKNIINEKIGFLSKWIDDNIVLVNYFNKKIKEITEGEKKTYDIKIYLYAAYAFLYDIEVRKDEDIDSEDINKPFLSYIIKNQFEHSKLDFLSEEIKKTSPFNKILEKTSNMSLETLISLIQLTISYDVFCKHLGYGNHEIYYKLNTDKFEYHLFWYCVVKTVKTIKYNTNRLFSESFEPKNILKNNKSDLQYLTKRYFVDIIRIDKSHITDKLRRSILLLELIKNPIKKTLQIDGEYKIFSSSSLIDYYRKIVNNGRSTKWNLQNWEFSRDIEELGDLINNTKAIYSRKNIELTDLLPPAIFDYDFYSSIKEKEKKIPLSKISSGQFQKLGLLSSIVYHLKNLDSIQKRANFNSYKQVLVVLDEIELYFHPEQQREFVNDLVRLLKLNKFKQIENINIFFITHSPFILSDIPSQNVLRLKQGKSLQDENGLNSFGANIHDLLADEFFLENGFMGEFATLKINEIFNRLKEINSKISKEQYDSLLREINLIGEIIIKQPLLDLLHNKFKDSLSDNELLVRYYENKIKELTK